MYSIKNDEHEHDKVNPMHGNIRSGPESFTIVGGKRMATTVNLDALIPREDFEIESEGSEDWNKGEVQISDLQNDAFFSVRFVSRTFNERLSNGTPSV
jgi:hypothetical protein